MQLLHNTQLVHFIALYIFWEKGIVLFPKWTNSYKQGITVIKHFTYILLYISHKLEKGRKQHQQFFKCSINTKKKSAQVFVLSLLRRHSKTLCSLPVALAEELPAFIVFAWEREIRHLIVFTQWTHCHRWCSCHSPSHRSWCRGLHLENCMESLTDRALSSTYCLNKYKIRLKRKGFVKFFWSRATRPGPVQVIDSLPQ